MTRRGRAAAAAALVLASLGAASCGGAPEASAPARTPEAPGAPARSEPFSLVPDAPGDRVALAAPPGAVAAVGVRVGNGADRARSFSLRADAPWIDVPTAVTVPPRQSRAVAARVRVPSGARPGRLRGDIVARAGGDPAAAVSVSYEASVPVLVTVTPPGAP